MERCHNSAKIILTDDGPGVTKDEMESLGQRGLRLDEQTPGHGLGLAIVREIVTRYAGSISFSASSMGGLKVLIEIAVQETDKSCTDRN